MRFTFALAAVGALIGLALASPARGQRFTFAQDGRPAATIVTAAEPTANAAKAAEELQHYVEKISGARLPIVAEGAPAPGAAAPAPGAAAALPGGRLILVGATRAAEGIPNIEIPAGLTKDLREEGFVIRLHRDRLVLAGNDEGPYLGTRYAVAELLHRLGVRWFVPGAWGEVVPRRPTVVLDAADLDTLQRPSFPMRDWWEHSRDQAMRDDRIEWKIRHKMNPVITHWFGVPSDGSIRGFLPGEDVFQQHPEWFALEQDRQTRNPHMACMTSEGMIEHFIARVKENAAKGARVSAFAPDDGNPRCWCDDCRRVSTAFDGYGSNERDPVPEQSTSNEWFYFVHRILTAVNREFPEHKISTNGYANRDIPPEVAPISGRGAFNPDGNLVVMFANIGACTLHAYDDPGCWQMQRQGDMVRRWCELSDKVWIYNYNYTMLVSKYTLTPMVSRIRRNIPQLHRWGLVGFFDQDEGDWALTGFPTRIVRAALEWDVNADVDAVQADYFRLWYGPASRPMSQYYDALERAFATTDRHGHEDVVLPEIYTPELLRRLDRLIEQAEQAGDAEPVRTRLALDRLNHEHLHAFVAMQEAKQECNFGRAAMLADRMTELTEAKGRITPFAGYHPYPVYEPRWEAARLRRLEAKTTGAEGELVAILPESVKFATDPMDEGRFARWFEPSVNDRRWKSLRTTAGWDAQGLQDASGYPYRGVAWYRTEVDVPASAAGKTVRLHAPAVVNEAWVWVNGQYAGRREYKAPWFRPQELDLDVSDLIEPGRPNQITLRVLCNSDVWGANGIYERMFLYAAKPQAAER